MRMPVELHPFLCHTDKAIRLYLLVEEMEYQPLMHDRTPEFCRMLLPCPEKLQFIMPVRLDKRIGLTCEDIRQVLYLEMLRKRQHEFHHKKHLLLAVELFLRMQTVVAGATVVPGIVLTEIVEKEFPPALVRLGIGNGLHKKLFPDLLLCDRLALHELLEFLDILITVICDTYAFFPVAAGPAGLLVITLYALRYIVMYNIPHIRLVYPHAEGYCGDYDIHFFHQEPVLVLGPRLRIKPRMIRKCLYSVDIQKFRQFLNFLSAETVYYP